MIPIRDEHRLLRPPLTTAVFLVGTVAIWFFVQEAGSHPFYVALSTCHLGLVPGEISGRARIGEMVTPWPGLLCVVDRDPFNYVTPLTSPFVHTSWGHLLVGLFFLWAFGSDVEDSLGRLRFAVLYLFCSLVASATHVLVDPVSPVPVVGASGAVAGVLGAYLGLYPRARVDLLFTPWSVPAYALPFWWAVLQVGLAQSGSIIVPPARAGWGALSQACAAVAGLLLVRLLRNPALIRERIRAR